MSAAGSWVSAATAAVRGGRPPFMLCYHGFGEAGVEGDPHGLMAPVPLFEDHLDVIANREYTLVHVADLWRRTEAGEEIQGLGAVTIDDGLADSMEKAVEVLSRRGMTATAYIPTGLLGQPHPHLPGKARIVDRAQLLELDAAGLEIGSHTIDHPDLATLAYPAVLDQLRRSRATLEDLLGRRIDTLAYPFGSFTEATERAAEEAGYATACGCSGPAPWRAFSLPREPVYPTTTPVRLGMKVAGLYGPGHAAAKLRNRLKRPPRHTVVLEDRRDNRREERKPGAPGYRGTAT